MRIPEASLLADLPVDVEDWHPPGVAIARQLQATLAAVSVQLARVSTNGQEWLLAVVPEGSLARWPACGGMSRRTSVGL